VSAQPVEPVEPVEVGIRDDQRFTEAGALEALRAALIGPAAPAAPDTSDGKKAQASESARKRKRDARVVLDDFWGNHAILHGDFRTLRASELEEIVLAHFTDTYGIEGESLLVRFCVQRGGRTLFASAMSRALHDGLYEVAATEGLRISHLRLCLPQMLNRIGEVSLSGTALLVFLSDELMQIVMSEGNRWVAYDAQRLFPGDADDGARVALLAENAFERLATQASLKREACAIHLFGNEIDLASFEGRFAAAMRPAQPAMARSSARRLMEYAR
jgi:hypothetical protein